MAIVDGDTVQFEYVGKTADGTVFDTSVEATAEESGLATDHPEREYAPLTVEIGAGRIIEGLEEALVGMEVGEETTVQVPPEKGYGERREELVAEYDAEEFAGMLQGAEPEAGMHVQTEQGELGTVTRVGSETVDVDFNHELAGEALEFDVEIVDVDAED